MPAKLPSPAKATFKSRRLPAQLVSSAGSIATAAVERTVATAAPPAPTYEHPREREERLILDVRTEPHRQPSEPRCRFQPTQRQHEREQHERVRLRRRPLRLHL